MAKDVPWDDSNWRQEFKESRNLSKYQLEILTNGPRSLAQSWMLGAMHTQWREMNGYKYPDPPDCSSSFKEFNQSVKEHFEHGNPPEACGPGGPLTDQAGSGTH